ncbi:MAG: LysM peptidoglycan-binding domain-containing protein [Clostridiales bacterium]|nr:LysM peptidoglycan-binding domain-containing protein [Clostridiales bacterium]
MEQGRICPRGAGYYIWQQGDSLAGVAARNSTTAQAIRVINPDVDFDTLAAGSEICLPSQSYTCISGQPYTVRQGDTFSGIAEALNISVYELAERNPGVTPDSLMPGQILCVPAQAELPTSCPSGYTAGRIARGDTYAQLLIRHNVSYNAMRSANPGLQPGGLIAGEAYCAPPQGARQVCPEGGRFYTIERGETLLTVANVLGVTPGRLLRSNPSLLPSDFAQGTVICVPD